MQTQLTLIAQHHLPANAAIIAVFFPTLPQDDVVAIIAVGSHTTPQSKIRTSFSKGEFKKGL